MILGAIAALALTPAPPPIQRDLIPFGARRKRETAAYNARHYGQRRWRLRDPHVIVEHIAVAASASAVRNTFAPDVADPELHERPGVCAHYVIGARGDVHLLVSTSIRCRHTVGLNWTAIGIEHVGYSDGDLMANRRELQSSLRLSRYLRCRYGIRLRDVIGHNESLSSPYHHERVRRLRFQTHGDMAHATMVRYRRMLAPCP